MTAKKYRVLAREFYGFAERGGWCHRRVASYGPWRTLAKLDSEAAARGYLEQARVQGGLWQFRIAYGRKVWK
jgi:hypothetical protein